MRVYDLINELMIRSKGDLNKTVVLLDSKDPEKVYSTFEVFLDGETNAVTVSKMRSEYQKGE